MTKRKLDDDKRLVTYDVKLGSKGSILTKIGNSQWCIQAVQITAGLTLQRYLAEGYRHVKAQDVRHEYANLKVLPEVAEKPKEK